MSDIQSYSDYYKIWPKNIKSVLKVMAIFHYNVLDGYCSVHQTINSDFDNL